MKEEKELPHSELTGAILSCCFEVMRELGPGFLERVYKNALLMAMRQKGLEVDVERPYEVIFRGKVMGRYIPNVIQKLVLEPRENSRGSTIISGLVLNQYKPTYDR